MSKLSAMAFGTLLLILGISACSKNEPETPVDDGLPATVAFNEIHATGNPDWIELYNYGEEVVDLEGFKVFDREENIYSLPSGNSMDPGDFLILICDDQGTGLNMPFKLTSEGERITLQRPDGKMIDHVVFPAMENGRTYARFPDGSGNWQLTGFVTRNKTNGTGPVSYFRSFSYVPDIPLVGDDIIFSLEISDGSNVSGVQMFYAIDNGAFESLGMNVIDMNNYQVTIPALDSDGELHYYFKLTDSGGSEVLLPHDALEDPYDMTITSGDVPSLVINEIMASNQNLLADPDGVGEYDDWVEIYNTGTTAIDMGRFYFSDSEDPFDYRIPGDMPEKTTVQPGGFLLYWADSDTEQGPNHLKFKLSAKGETISLYFKDGRLIDSHTFGLQSADVSEGRSPDGGNDWVKFNTPTPGESNQ